MGKRHKVPAATRERKQEYLDKQRSITPFDSEPNFNKIAFPAKSIPDFPGYFADINGHVWSCGGQQIKLLVHSIGETGYHRVMLRWGTCAENTEDQFRLGTVKIGARHAMAKLDDTKVLEIWRLKDKFTHEEIAKRFGVSKSTISHIYTGRAWTHVEVLQNV